MTTFREKLQAIGKPDKPIIERKCPSCGGTGWIHVYRGHRKEALKCTACHRTGKA